MLICECCGQTIKAPRKVAAKAPRFKGYDDFSPANVAAKNAAASQLGLSWHLVPGASVLARLPAAWVACKVFGRVSKSPRDVRLPAARFWPNGMLPVGPEYGTEGPREPELTREAMTAWRKFQMITDTERRKAAAFEWMASHPTQRSRGWTPRIVEAA